MKSRKKIQYAILANTALFNTFIITFWKMYWSISLILLIRSQWVFVFVSCMADTEKKRVRMDIESIYNNAPYFTRLNGWTEKKMSLQVKKITDICIVFISRHLMGRDDWLISRSLVQPFPVLWAHIVSHFWKKSANYYLRELRIHTEQFIYYMRNR